MTSDIQKILQSKRELRQGLAALPIEEKLRLLDALRERQLTLREQPPVYRTKPTNHTNEHESQTSLESDFSPAAIRVDS